jgi:hypothetical protein
MTQRDDDDAASVVDARALLSDADGNPTPQYKAYLAHQDEYNRKRREYDEAYERAKSSPMMLQRWPMLGKDYSDAITGAMNNWIALGHKHAIEKALGVLQSTGQQGLAEGR